MGLLKGLSERASWAKSVRGYMTIGSPLNKHVFFWPELFKMYDSDKADPAILPIPWKNYYDYGDPIAFNLKQTRDWMRETKWHRFFTFRDEKGEDDIGFTRYYFPARHITTTGGTAMSSDTSFSKSSTEQARSCPR